MLKSESKSKKKLSTPEVKFTKHKSSKHVEKEKAVKKEKEKKPAKEKKVKIKGKDKEKDKHDEKAVREIEQYDDKPVSRKARAHGENHFFRC